MTLKLLKNSTFGAFAIVALLFAGPSPAQENLDHGKSPAQLFASDCTMCHKSPQGLIKSGGMFTGVDGFLRQHYTASRETAAALAKYLEAAGDAPVAATRTKRSTRSSDKEKASAKKPAEAKPAETKPADEKSATAKTDAKPAEAKSEAKTEAKSEAKPEAKAEAKTEAKVEAKPEPKAEAKPEAKAEAKPEAKVEAKPASTPAPKSEDKPPSADKKSD